MEVPLGLRVMLRPVVASIQTRASEPSTSSASFQQTAPNATTAAPATPALLTTTPPPTAILPALTSPYSVLSESSSDSSPINSPDKPVFLENLLEQSSHLHLAQQQAQSLYATLPPQYLAALQFPMLNVDTNQMFSQLGVAPSALSPHSEVDIRTEESKGCTCKKSKCLKRYCECFSAGNMCNRHCRCINCSNNSLNAESRNQTMQNLLNRNPHAFQLNEKTRQGCRCRRSGCIKKYCECFRGGRQCMEACECTFFQECKNGGAHRPQLGQKRPSASSSISASDSDPEKITDEQMADSSSNSSAVPAQSLPPAASESTSTAIATTNASPGSPAHSNLLPATPPTPNTPATFPSSPLQSKLSAELRTPTTSGTQLEQSSKKRKAAPADVNECTVAPSLRKQLKSRSLENLESSNDAATTAAILCNFAVQLHA